MLKKLNKFKLSTFVITLLILVQGVGMVFGYKSVIKDQQIKNLQINSLVQEIGDLKEENLSLNNKIVDLSQKTLNDIKSIENNYKSAYSSSDENIKSLINQLETTKKTYSQVITDKQTSIDSLINKNQKLDELKNLNNQIKSVLLLGENQHLTDTIILVTINPDKKLITFIGIPRDFFIGGRKINEYYQKYGIESLNQQIETITGIMPDHYVKVNFTAFEEIIDSIGGLNIEIEKDLVDERYPTDNFGYKTVTFTKGQEQMSGSRALEYARSRKSTTDFDRIKRQQQIISAISEKIKTLEFTNNINTFAKIFQSLDKNIETDLNILEIAGMYEEYKDYQISRNNVLDNSNYLFSATNTAGQYILLPIKNDYNRIKEGIIKLI